MAGRLGFGLLLAMLVLGSPVGVAGDHDAPRTPRAVGRAPLDLRAPPLNHVVSPRQIAALTADAAETSADDVTIRADHSTPACCGNLIALPWAFMHPRRAWQIFTPVVGACPGMWCTDGK
jgi:hypothetical protein